MQYKASHRPIKLLFAHDRTGYAAKSPGNKGATGQSIPFGWNPGSSMSGTQNGRNPAVGYAISFGTEAALVASRTDGYFDAVGNGTGLSESDRR
jgi:hypothetical protein